MVRQIQWPQTDGTAARAPSTPDHCTRPGIARQHYRMRLLTPVFTSVVSAQAGGDIDGYEYGDAVSPVRGTAIRSQLRFWWRATRGAVFQTTKELYDAERAIWGGPANDTNEDEEPSVDVNVTISDGDRAGLRHVIFEQVTRIDVPKHIKQPNALGYVLWPFDLSETGQVPIRGVRDLKFTLTLSFPERVQEDVEAAVWAWSTFGGLGARTRRGCGALGNKASGVLAGSAGQKKVEKWLRQKLEKYGSDVHRPWPTLSNRALLQTEVNARSEDGQEANWLATVRSWIKAVEALQIFRQGIGVARESSGKDGKFPGVTRWPEAEAIRSNTQRSDKVLAERPELPGDYFPRAEFGMPLGFHFTLSGDPPPHQVVPLLNDEQKDRMASPLIVKPLAVAAHDSSYYPLIGRLNCSTSCEFVSVMNEEGSEPLPAEMISRELAAKLQVTEMKSTESGSAVDAFWNWAKSKGGFTEIANLGDSAGESE